MDDSLTAEDKEFLAQCEEEFKDRFTENDEEFMKVFNKEQSVPPILEKWWAPIIRGPRNDRRNNRHTPYDEDYRRHRNNSRNNSGPRRYNDYNSYDSNRSRY